MTTKKLKVGNVPNLRFPGFDGEWETKKLGKIATFSKGKGISKSDIESNGTTECIRYGELYTHYGEVINEIRSKTNLDSSTLILSEENDVIIPASGETAIDIATASCVMKPGIALSGDLNIIRSKINGVFLSYYLNSKKKMEIANLAQGISVVHLYSSQLASLSLNLPKSKEQNAIASFFSLLDERIATQNKIIEELEVLKTTITKEIFSGQLKLKDENGNSFPQWEQRKLGEVTNIKSGLSKEQNDNSYGYKVTRIETISDGTINLNKIGHIDFDGNIDDYKIKKGDILFSNINSVSHIGKTAIAYSDLDLYHGMNLLCIKSKYELDPFFLYCYLNTVKIRNYFRSICNQAVSQASINQTELAKTIIVLPSRKEQTKIATFLRFIFSKIDLEVGLLNQLEKQKKFLLQQMFV